VVHSINYASVIPGWQRERLRCRQASEIRTPSRFVSALHVSRQSPEDRQRLTIRASRHEAPTGVIYRKGFHQPKDRQHICGLLLCETLYQPKAVYQPQEGSYHIASIQDFDLATGWVSAPPPLDFPDIQTVPTEQACLLVAQCVKTRFLLTRDWLVKWADAANLGGMLLQSPNKFQASSVAMSCRGVYELVSKT
jgi:hypothetical protein